MRLQGITPCYNAQENLVFNGDFEEYSECPLGFTDPFQNPKEITKCLGWKAPTYGTSDFYHECAIGTNVSVPNSTSGIQNAFNGKGYLGGFLASLTGGAGDDGYNGIMWWEYVQGELVKPLEKGKKYNLSIRISVAEYFDLVVKEFGAYFSESPISSLNTASLTVTPQCTFYNNSYFKDSINWVEVKSSFVSDGNEKFITIGNINNNITSDTARRLEMEHPLYAAYMYFDAVELFEDTKAIELANFISPNNDGINDYWYYPILNSGNEIYILNRWGSVIQILNKKNPQWDGTSKEGKDCSEGIYYYKINETNKTGFIQLIR